MEALEQNNAACILISKQSDCIIRSLLQITEANNVAVGFSGIQDTVGYGIQKLTRSFCCLRVMSS